VVAVDGITTQLGRLPHSIRLVGYRTITFFDEDLPARLSEIADAPARSHLALVTQVFEIQADNKIFRVTVDGTDAKVAERQ
jgi:hypothetical protein